MYEDEIAQLMELIPKGVEPGGLPFTDLGDLFCFIGMLVVGGFITMWLAWKMILCGKERGPVF